MIHGPVVETTLLKGLLVCLCIYICNIGMTSYRLLYSINPSLCTDTTGCGTCQGSIYNIVKHNLYS